MWTILRIRKTDRSTQRNTLYIHGFSHLVGSLLKVGRQKEIESLTAAERKCNKGSEFISFPSPSSSFYHRCRRRVHVSVGRSQPPFSSFLHSAFTHSLSLARSFVFRKGSLVKSPEPLLFATLIWSLGGYYRIFTTSSCSPRKITKIKRCLARLSFLLRNFILRRRRHRKGKQIDCRTSKAEVLEEKRTKTTTSLDSSPAFLPYDSVSSKTVKRNLFQLVLPARLPACLYR